MTEITKLKLGSNTKIQMIKIDDKISYQHWRLFLICLLYKMICMQFLGDIMIQIIIIIISFQIISFN